MDEETAAAVLTKLNPRNASAILNEMPAAQAARLTGTIAGAARVTPDKTKS
jgi:flagellar motility protein MotE (MotC chaperone)